MLAIIAACTIAATNLSPEQVVARTLWGEARGESITGKVAVASVIYNRAKSNPKKLKAVCLKRKQFSCWNGRTIKAGKGKAWQECLKIAREMLSGKFKPTINADHYYNPKLCNPKWAWGHEVKMIGNHAFLKLRK